MLHSEIKHTGVWARRFVWMPKTCAFTEKIIWLKFGYTVVRTIPVTPRITQITGCANNMQIRLWVDADEFIILRLKGIIK